MTADKITIEDIKGKAEGVRDLAIVEAKETARELASDKLTTVVLIGVGAIALIASFAYMIGTRAGRSATEAAAREYVRRRAADAAAYALTDMSDL